MRDHMVTLIYYKAIAAILIFLVAFTAAIALLKRKHAPRHAESIELGEALASGIFLGAAFFHMLPDAIRLFSHLYGTLNYPVPEVICVAGFLLLLFLERLSLGNASIQSTSIPYILALILIIHAVTEGAALGIGSTLAETVMLFIAILVHKGSESFALCIILLRHKLPFNRIFMIIILFSLMTPAGILFGAVINQLTFARNGELIAAIFNAFAAGTFLYISTLHHIHFHQHTKDKQGILEFTSLMTGASVMGIIALWT